ncbi:hypothetical protein [Brevundimonas sp.]|uniref:hypothetical protein n=1 Tax=Brevundimonas sp. TaxID=1871086 RepID=UPI0025C18B17|nr:hypothetical protein [Brevundimonas sp.]
MTSHLRPIVEVVVRQGVDDGYVAARMDVTLSSLLAAQESEGDFVVSVWLNPGNQIDPICDRFPQLKIKAVDANSRATASSPADLSFAFTARQPFFVVVEAGQSLPCSLGRTTLVENGRAVLNIRTGPSDLSRVWRDGLYVGGIAAANDMSLHEGLFVYATMLAERAHILLTALHGADLLALVTAGIDGPAAYVTANDDRLADWHCVRRVPAAPLVLAPAPDVRGLGRSRSLDRIYAQLFKVV